MTTLYLDYVGHGIWALSDTQDFRFPRLKVCGSPVRLLQDHKTEGVEIVLSPAAELVCNNCLADMHWTDQWVKLINNEHPECGYMMIDKLEGDLDNDGGIR